MGVAFSFLVTASSLGFIQLSSFDRYATYSFVIQTRTYLANKQTDQALMNEVIRKFSGCSSYRKDMFAGTSSGSPGISCAMFTYRVPSKTY